MFDLKNLDAVARDVAMEIQVGGDRFSPADICEMLSGMPERDRQTFRERVLLHCRDFAPYRPEYYNYAFKAVEPWIDAIETAESLGRKPEKFWFDGVELRDDKWLFLTFDDGSVEFCPKSDRRSVFPEERLSHVTGSLDAAATLRKVFEELLSFSVKPSYVFDGILTQEGRLISVGAVPEGFPFDCPDGHAVFFDNGRYMTLEKFIENSVMRESLVMNRKCGRMKTGTS